MEDEGTGEGPRVTECRSGDKVATPVATQCNRLWPQGRVAIPCNRLRLSSRRQGAEGIDGCSGTGRVKGPSVSHSRLHSRLQSVRQSVTVG